MLSTRRLVKFVPPQVASWFGGLPAAAKEVGNLKCCRAVSAAASSRAHVPPCANGSDGVISTAGFMKARFLVINSLCTQECCTGTDGDVLGLRFIEALLVFCLNTVAASGRMGTSPVACPWVTGFRLQDGWTSKLVPPRPKEVSSGKALSLSKAKLDKVLVMTLLRLCTHTPCHTDIFLTHFPCVTYRPRVHAWLTVFAVRMSYLSISPSPFSRIIRLPC